MTRGLIKTHKPHCPILPVVNWKSTPRYKLSELFTDKINQLILLPHVHLIQLLKEIPLHADTKFASLDISSMFSNIPTAEINILRDIIDVNMLSTDRK